MLCQPPIAQTTNMRPRFDVGSIEKYIHSNISLMKYFVGECVRISILLKNTRVFPYSRLKFVPRWIKLWPPTFRAGVELTRVKNI